MILYNEENIKILSVKCSRPKMNDRRGRTWDQGTIIIDGKEKTVYLDTTWGFYCYFVENGQWYKIKMFASSFEPNYDVDPFLNPSYKLFSEEQICPV